MGFLVDWLVGFCMCIFVLVVFGFQSFNKYKLLCVGVNFSHNQINKSVITVFQLAKEN